MLTIKREISIPIQTADIAGAYAYIYVHLGDIRKSEDKLQEAINCYGESKKIITCFKESSYSAKMQTLSGLDYIEALILYKTGEIHQVLGENLTSISYFRQSIEIVKQHDSIDALELYLTLCLALGDMFKTTQAFSIAKEWYQSAQSGAEKLLTQSPSVANKEMLAAIYFRLYTVSQTDDRLIFLDSALTLYEDLYKQNPLQQYLKQLIVLSAIRKTLFNNGQQ